MSIKTESLNYTYNRKSPFEKHALKDIDLQIDEGDFFGIVGHTGSGKSTLIQHFNALIKVQKGHLFVSGHDLAAKRINYKNLRSDVGMLFQYPEYQLFASTVLKDVMFGLKNFNDRKKPKKGESEENFIPLSEQQMIQMSKEAIEMVGLDFEEIKEKSPFDLSGGQKRRVALAGVIVTKPKVLVLDEPSSGLDPKGKVEIMKLIHSLRSTCVKTIVMISHDMDEVASNCNKIAVLNKGRVEFVLQPSELHLHKNRLIELGLDVPITVKVALALQGRGFDIDPSICDMQELANKIAGGIKC